MRTLAALVLLTVPASADWQYTRWGMTPAEVRAADSSVADLKTKDREERTSNKQVALLGAHYRAMGRRFDAYFYFDRPGGRLKRVLLDPTGDRDCDGLLLDLRRTYGTPDEETHPFPKIAPNLIESRWFDRGNSNEVYLHSDAKDASSPCDLGYIELKAPGAKGGL